MFFIFCHNLIYWNLFFPRSLIKLSYLIHDPYNYVISERTITILLLKATKVIQHQKIRTISKSFQTLLYLFFSCMFVSRTLSFLFILLCVLPHPDCPIGYTSISFCAFGLILPSAERLQVEIRSCSSAIVIYSIITMRRPFNEIWMFIISTYYIKFDFVD